MKKIGLFLCECGGNISDSVDFDAVEKELADKGFAVTVHRHRLLCSNEGQMDMAEKIDSESLEAVVVAACSPKAHEPTFMKVLTGAGLNPYLLQMVNIREHCAWVTSDKNAATKKALAQIRAGIKRVSFQQPLEPKEIECLPDVLIIGAGIAGMEAALRLAESGQRKVILVDKEPCLGGKVTMFDELFPDLECAPCLLAPVMDQVIRNENIELLTLSEVTDAVGYLGNFSVTIRKKPRYVNALNCLGCRQCSEACPVSVTSDYHFGLGTRKAIFTPYAGSLPNVSVVDAGNCLKLKGEECGKCLEACMFGAIEFNQREEIIERRAGAVIIATGFEEYIPDGMIEKTPGSLRNILSGLEFERILSTTGPTEGKILTAEGAEPKKIAIVHCVGGRDPGDVPYCSSVCCQASVKMAKNIEKKISGAEVVQFYRDWCLPGLDAQGFFQGQGKMVKQVRYANPGDVKVRNRDGKPMVAFKTPGGELKEEAFDLAVLLGAMKPARGFEQLAGLFQVTLKEDGYHASAQAHLNQVGANIEGVLVAGCAAGPGSSAQAAATAQAAAARVMAALVPGKKLQLEAIVTRIDEDLCSGCKTCISLCPFRAIRYDEEKKIAIVNEALCKGCGTCAAACPSGAAASLNFTSDQVFAEIEEVSR